MSTDYKCIPFGFPTYKTAFEDKISESKQALPSTYSYSDSFGNTIEMKGYSLSDEDVDATTDLIASISYQNYSATIVPDIVIEELEFYHSGDKGLEEMIEIINNKVGTYMNEN